MNMEVGLQSLPCGCAQFKGGGWCVPTTQRDQPLGCTCSGIKGCVSRLQKIITARATYLSHHYMKLKI